MKMARRKIVRTEEEGKKEGGVMDIGRRKILRRKERRREE